MDFIHRNKPARANNRESSLVILNSRANHVETLLMQPGAALASVFRSCTFDPSTSSAAQVQSVAVTHSASPAAGSRDV
jgi:hypothetical protein